MEMLVVVAQHRNQCYSRGKSQISDGFGSSSSQGFRGINCRTFQSGGGILPSPSPKLPSFASPPPLKPRSYFYSEPAKQTRRSNPSSVIHRATAQVVPFSDELSDSERWAGPAYTNSPPPSSLPIPKFSLRQKHSISLELPVSNSGIKFHPIARSAPPSPMRESYSSVSDFFFSTDSATQDLRRILHLDVAATE